MEIEIVELIRKVESKIRRTKLLRAMFFYDEIIQRDLKLYEEILCSLLTLKQLLKQEKTPN